MTRKYLLGEVPTDRETFLKWVVGHRKAVGLRSLTPDNEFVEQMTPEEAMTSMANFELKYMDRWGGAVDFLGVAVCYMGQPQPIENQPDSSPERFAVYKISLEPPHLPGGEPQI